MKNRTTSAGTDAQQSDAAEVPTSSQPCSNTFVIGSQSPPKIEPITFVESSSTFLMLCEEIKVFVGSSGQILVDLG